MKNFDKIVTGAIELAQSEVLKRKNAELTEHHLLWGLIKNPQSSANKHLKSELKVIEGLLDTLPTVESISFEQVKPSPKFSEWMTMASSHAIQSGREEITEADLLQYFKNYYPQIKLDVPEEQEGFELPDFIVNLNDMADAGKLDPVIGRSTEIRRVQEILCRRTKNNPVLVGPPGVGKTAIVEGLAGLIQSDEVPDIIQGKTIYSLNLGALMSGTKYRGEFEEKIQQLINFLKKENRKAILFIDEIHLLIGAGKTDGALDAANLLKPELARGELNCIGATTFDEYKKYIESDSALERRFHMVKVDQPTKEDTIQILMGLKEKFEIHHGIEITEEAIIAATYLSDQYIAERFLPDKAIDIIDEGASGLKLSADSVPPEITELEALIVSKKILSKSLKEPKKLVDEIKELESKLKTQKEEWEKKNFELKKVAALKKELDQLQFQLQKAEKEGDYETASRLKYSELPKIESDLAKHQVTWKLTKQNVAEVISKSTGIPVEKILKDRQENMLELEDYLKRKVFGQDPALEEISETIIASHAGLSDESRPLGSFLLLGPSGVGKTETAKALATFLFESENKLIRIDLSEYSEAHSVSKLIGAPPGYVGYEKGGVLTEAVRRNPYSVILFDEIEKAHINFSDILLQLMDDGRLTDTQGRTVNFKNTIVIITSNLKDYKNFLKPELIGRLDSIIQYHSLDESVMDQLIERELATLNSRLQDKELKVEIDDELKKQIKEAGFDEIYGARPLKNAFQRRVTRPISKIILKNPELKGTYQLNANLAS